MKIKFEAYYITPSKTDKKITWNLEFAFDPKPPPPSPTAYDLFDSEKFVFNACRDVFGWVLSLPPPPFENDSKCLKYGVWKS